MKKKIVAGNWKMNKTPEASLELAKDIIALLEQQALTMSAIEVVLAPPFTSLTGVYEIVKEHNHIFLGAQNCHTAKQGAFTGEISAEMLANAGCSYIIIGHSERRSLFNESDTFLAEKVAAVLNESLKPIFCCGELLPQRENGKFKNVVEQQLKNGLFNLSPDAFKNVVIAYEPVWAIGTGVTASPEQAQEMHHFIRGLIAEKYGDSIAQATTLLYGGSCNAANARELFNQPDVDGGLIGGASLKAQDFVAIIHSF